MLKNTENIKESITLASVYVITIILQIGFFQNKGSSPKLALMLSELINCYSPEIIRKL